MPLAVFRKRTWSNQGSSKHSVLTLITGVALTGVVHAGFLPDDPDAFVKRMRQVVNAQDGAVMLGLYNWERVKKHTRKQIESEVAGLMSLDITSIDVMELPPTVSSEITSNGKRYEMNLEPERMIVIRYNGDNGPSSAGMPIGKTPEGYAIGITIEVGDAVAEEPSTRIAAVSEPKQPDEPVEQAESAPAPSAVLDQLLVDVEADPGVITEIACAYFETPGGERIVETWRGEGSFKREVPGSSFDTCAAKKRSGAGRTRVTLAEGGDTVYSETGTSAEDPLVYMRQ